jgi:hypothetical protein
LGGRNHISTDYPPRTHMDPSRRAQPYERTHCATVLPAPVDVCCGVASGASRIQNGDADSGRPRPDTRETVGQQGTYWPIAVGQPKELTMMVGLVPE